MKYIIDIPDNTHWIQWIMEGTKDHHPYMDWIDVKDLRFYTELDRKAIEDEVWNFARKIICPSDCCEDSISKYTEKFLGIPSHKARAIFKDLSYQEAKSKFEAWLKQKEDEESLKDVTALADKIGIHKLYALVREMRGEE